MTRSSRVRVIRAAAVKRQSTGGRRRCARVQTATWVARVAWSAMRRARPCGPSAARSISAMVSQEPCLGVCTNSSVAAIRRAACGPKVSYRELSVCVFEMVAYDRDPDRVGEARVPAWPAPVSSCGAAGGERERADAQERGAPQEETGAAVTAAFRILAGGTARNHRPRRPHLAAELLASFIKTDHRVGGIALALIPQPPLHRRDLGPMGRTRQTPHRSQPGLEFVFLRMVRIVDPRDDLQLHQAIGPQRQGPAGPTVECARRADGGAFARDRPRFPGADPRVAPAPPLVSNASAIRACCHRGPSAP